MARKSGPPANGLPALSNADLLKYAKRFWHGGDSNDLKVRYDEVPADELALGIREELEHTPDKIFAFKIALDHLSRMPAYYSNLREMERRLKGH